jgi:hypothetical protein
LSTSNDGTLRLWDLETGKELHRTESMGVPLPCVAFSPDGKRALVGFDGGGLRLWDVDNWKEILSLEGHTSHVVCVVFSPDGKQAASAGEHDHTARIWEVETGKELVKLEGHTDAVHCVAFSPDGRRVLTGAGGKEEGAVGTDNSLRLWDARTGKELRKFEGHDEGIWGVAFSPDGRRALSGSGRFTLDSLDTTVRLWDLETGKELQRFEGHTQTVWSVAFSRDGRQGLSAGDQKVRLWRLP